MHIMAIHRSCDERASHHLKRSEFGPNGPELLPQAAVLYGFLAAVRVGGFGVRFWGLRGQVVPSVVLRM